MKIYFIKTSIILSLIKFAALALIVLFIASQMGMIPTKYKAYISADSWRIKKVIRQTDEILASRPKLESREEVKKHFESTIDTLKSIDASVCPYDFRIAFEHFVQAYEGLYNQMQADPDRFFSQFFSDPDSEENKSLYAQFNEAATEIDHVAMRFGVK